MVLSQGLKKWWGKETPFRKPIKCLSVSLETLRKQRPISFVRKGWKNEVLVTLRHDVHSCWWVLIVGILTTFGGALFDLWCFFQHNIDHRNFIFVVNFIRLCFISMLLLFPLSNIISNSNWVERTEKSATSIFSLNYSSLFLYNRFCLCLERFINLNERKSASKLR